MTLLKGIMPPVIYTLILLSAPYWLTMPSDYWLIPTSVLFVISIALRKTWLMTVFLALSIALIQGNVIKQQLNALFQFGTDVTIKARIDSHFKQITHGYEADATVLSINGQTISQIKRPKVKLRVNQRTEQGALITATAKIKPIIGLRNEVGYDKEKVMFSNGIVGTLSVSTSYIASSKGHLRSQWQYLISQYVENSRYAGFYSALLFGERSGVSSKQWSLLQQSGLIHLMAISGLHIGIVFGIGLLVGRVLRCSMSCIIKPYSKCRQFGVYLPIVSGLLLAYGYGWIAHFSLPTVRALIMLTLLSLSHMIRPQLSALFVLCLTAALLLTLMPFSGLNMSFWMSLSAVAILLLSSKIIKRGSLIQTAILTQVLLVLLFAPIVAWLYLGISISAIVYNLVFVPWFSIVVLPWLFFSFVVSLTPLTFLATVSWQISDWLIAPIFYTLTWSPMGWFSVSHHEWLLLVVLAVGTILIPMLSGYARWCLLSLVLTSWLTFREQTNSWSLSVLDVGHGLAIVLIKGNEAIIYDTGDKWAQASVASQIISPFLVKRGVEKLEGIVISHFDKDHAGGLDDLQRQWRPQWVRSSENREQSLACRQGERWQWQHIEFYALWPPKTVNRAYNPHSCVIRVFDKQNQVSFLLPGDVETVSEILLTRGAGEIRSDVMIVPHHGSQTSSSQFLLDSVQPQYAVASLKHNNRWNMPSDKVVERYRELGANWLDTGQFGQITFTVADKTLYISHLRGGENASWYRKMLRSAVE